jgi:DNA mismatch repair protein MSH2
LAIFPDVHRLARKIERGRGSLADMVRLHSAMAVVPKLKQILETLADSVGCVLVERLKYLEGPLAAFDNFVKNTVDLAGGPSVSHGPVLVRASLDASLAALAAERAQIQETRVAPVLMQAARHFGLEAGRRIRLVRHPIHGLALCVSRADAHRLGPLLKDNTVDDENSLYREICTLKRGILLTTAALREAHSLDTSLAHTYEMQQDALVEDILKTAATYAPLLYKVNAIVAEVDVLASFAQAVRAAPAPYCRPQFVDSLSIEGSLKLIDARHPILESLTSFVPNDCILGGRLQAQAAQESSHNNHLECNTLFESAKSLVKESNLLTMAPSSQIKNLNTNSSKFLVVTGPNMGGKSTYLRTVALVALMAHIGCLVPCTAAQIPLLDAIWARVGASDAPLIGVSTFLAEMRDMAGILCAATPASLILIDELGRGTSSAEGLALARAIAEAILSQNCSLTLFATHFHELADLADQFPGQAANVAVAACFSSSTNNSSAAANLTLLYKVMPGVGDHSFGLHIARMANMHPHTLAIAKYKASQLLKYAGNKNFSELNCISTEFFSSKLNLLATLVREVLKHLLDFEKLILDGSTDRELTSLDPLKMHLDTLFASD